MHLRLISVRAWALCAVVGSAACALSAARAGDVVFPGVEWTHREAGELGLDAARLDAVAAALGSRGCAVKDGYVVKTWGSQEQRSDWFSSAKPVLSTLLMFALQEGKIKSFDQPVADFGWELVPKDRTMTLRHLASMTSGYARPEEPGKAWAYNDYAIQLYQKTAVRQDLSRVQPEEVFHDREPTSGRWGCRTALPFARRIGG